MSACQDSLCGVPQGSLLGPIVFLLNIFPLDQIIIPFSDVFYHLYADYIYLYRSFKPAEYLDMFSL